MRTTTIAAVLSVTVGQVTHKGAGDPPPALRMTSDQTTPMIRYEVRYQVPYNQCEWRSQFFSTLAEAERMVEFYRSCGSPAHIA